VKRIVRIEQYIHVTSDQICSEKCFGFVLRNAKPACRAFKARSGESRRLQVVKGETLRCQICLESEVRRDGT
jgi:hypothetical protein